MVIADFNIPNVCPGPTEAKTPLIIDTDGMLPKTASFECLETVSGRNGQVRKENGFVDLDEFADGCSSDGSEDSAVTGFVESLGLTILKGENHGSEGR